MDARWFPSKRDAWIVALLYGAVVVVLVAFAGAWPGMGGLSRAVSVVLTVLTIGFLAWTLYGTGYGFEGGQLLVRSGPFRFRMDVSEIVEVTPSNNPLSSPACSLDRLLIRTSADRKMLISPLDKAGFLTALVTVGPHLVIEGDRVRLAA